MFSTLQYCPARTSHKYFPSSTNRVSRSASFRCSHARISSIFVSTNKARFLFSFGNIGGLLVRKLVKQTKIVSRTTDQSGIDHFRLSQTEADIRATGAGILRKPDAAVRQELRRFDPSDGIVDQSAEFVALLLGDGGTEILDLDQPALADEN